MKCQILFSRTNKKKFTLSSAEFTLSAQQTRTNTNGNSVDPDETACSNELSKQDLHSLPFSF